MIFVVDHILKSFRLKQKIPKKRPNFPKFEDAWLSQRLFFKSTQFINFSMCHSPLQTHPGSHLSFLTFERILPLNRFVSASLLSWIQPQAESHLRPIGGSFKYKSRASASWRWTQSQDSFSIHKIHFHSTNPHFEFLIPTMNNSQGHEFGRFAAFQIFDHCFSSPPAKTLFTFCSVFHLFLLYYPHITRILPQYYINSMRNSPQLRFNFFSPQYL